MWVVYECVWYISVVSLHCPMNLVGRDLLVKTGAAILCGFDGIQVRFPDGTELNCSASTPGATCRMLMNANTAPGEEGKGRYLLG